MEEQKSNSTPSPLEAPSPTTVETPLALAYLSGEGGPGNILSKVRVAASTVASATLAGAGLASATAFLLPLYAAILAGIIWCLIILNIDTMILEEIAERAGAARWFAMGRRLPIALLGSVIFVESCTVRAYGPEEDARIWRAQTQDTAEKRNAIETQHREATNATRTKFSTEIAQHEQAISNLQTQLNGASDLRRKAAHDSLEAVRNQRPRYLSDGTYYIDSSLSSAAKEEEQRLAHESEVLAETLKPELAHHRTEIDRLRAAELAEQARTDQVRTSALAVLDSTPTQSGLIDRLIAFEDICAENSTARWARRLIAALLMFVELVPTFSKFGRRCESALVNERMYGLFKDAIRSRRVQEGLLLWMETSAHTYVDAYMKNVDAAMGIRHDSGTGRSPGSPTSSTRSAQVVAPEPPPKDAADDRIHRRLQARSEASQRRGNAASNGGGHHGREKHDQD